MDAALRDLGITTPQYAVLTPAPPMGVPPPPPRGGTQQLLDEGTLHPQLCEPPGALAPVTRLLRAGGFRCFCGGQTVSMLGDGVHDI